MHEGIRKLKLERFKHIGLMDLPPEVKAFDRLQLDKTLDQAPYDCIITAALSLPDMKQLIDWAAKDKLTPDGILYVLYPKKGNPRYETFIHRDDIFTLDVDDKGFFGETDIKINSMTAFDEVFTVAGMKRVVSKEYKKPKVSQSVEDYRDRVDELKEMLTPSEQAAFDALTPGYQVGWARYLFSAVREDTRQKRLAETKTALAGGFKAIEFYKESLKKK